MDERRRGTLYGAAAYACWGLFPLYWEHLAPAGAVEVLAHRVVWSLLVVAGLVAVGRRTHAVRAVVRDRGRLLKLSAAAVFIAVNWVTYIYGVTSGHVVETSLGYFVNPIVTVLLAVLVLGERLRPLQWTAVGAAMVAVIVLTIQGGHPPWIALVLAFSFGFYGLLKKTASVGAVEGLVVETAVLAPLAVVFLAVLQATGRGTAVNHGPGHLALLVGAGIVTAGPLLLFGAAATRVPLATLGVLQYLAPTIQFVIGITVFGEPLPLLRVVGFALVWFGLVLFTLDLLTERRRSLLVPELV